MSAAERKFLRGAFARAGASAYDALAPHYRAYSQTKSEYLRAVDEIVKSRLASGALSLLDVGAGDGVRAQEIARACRVSRLVLAEPSPMMADYCRRLACAEVWQLGAEELPESTLKFDAVTCLWNVLGHVETGAKRLAALSRMRALLADGGLIFLDVNNRYNARAYGTLKTAARALFDLVSPSETNGDLSFEWEIGGRRIRARGHVFTPREVESLASRAGLRVRERHVIDYETGARRRFAFQGQLFYVLEREERAGSGDSRKRLGPVD
jgi:SAM-dependent methyltransferase